MKKICKQNDTISLLYASFEDIDLVYQMAMEVRDEEIFIKENVFADDWTYEAFRKDSDESIFFTGTANENNYLLIQYNSQIIGTISHTFNDATVKNMELDIWLRSKKCFGKGLGSMSIQLLISYLHSTYEITTFLLRPSNKNTRAIRAYSKCGFIYQEKFNPTLYYSAENLALWGEGDHGEENTYNMVLQL